MPKDDSPICFVIAPIGAEDSEERRRSDQILTHVIAPAAEDCGYDAVRADKISEPGIITSQVITHLLDDSMVIADLTGRNPNVFYELAVRHAVRKSVVQIIQTGEPIAFDVASTRTIQIDHRDLDSVAHCRAELVRQIHAAEKDPSHVDTPISVAIDLQTLRASDKPLEKSTADIMSLLQDMRSMISRMAVERETPYSSPSVIPPGLIDDVTRSYERVASLLQTAIPGNMWSEKQMEELQGAVEELQAASSYLERGFRQPTPKRRAAPRAAAPSPPPAAPPPAPSPPPPAPPPAPSPPPPA